MSTKPRKCGLSHQPAFNVFQSALLLLRVQGSKEQLSAANWSVE